MRRLICADDLARAVFSAAESSGTPVPRAEGKRMVDDVHTLCAAGEISGFADAAVATTAGYIFAIVAEQAYLLRWEPWARNNVPRHVAGASLSRAQERDRRSHRLRR
jgi:hypothetical protein